MDNSQRLRMHLGALAKLNPEITDAGMTFGLFGKRNYLLKFASTQEHLAPFSLRIKFEYYSSEYGGRDYMDLHSLIIHHDDEDTVIPFAECISQVPEPLYELIQAYRSRKVNEGHDNYESYCEAKAADMIEILKALTSDKQALAEEA